MSGLQRAAGSAGSAGSMGSGGDARLPLPEAQPGRLTGVRVVLVLIASVEIAVLLTAVPGLSPVRAAAVGAVLAAGAVAALLAVYMLGTSRPIPEVVGTAITLVVAGGLAFAPFAAGISDPTQTGPADLALSATCSATADARTVTATIEFRWLRTDLYPEGFAAPARGAATKDTIMLAVADASLGYADRLAPPYVATPAPAYVSTPSPEVERVPEQLGAIQNLGPLPWTAASGPASRTIDGHADAFGWSTSPARGLVHDPFGVGGMPGAMAVRPSSLRANASYDATWTFTKVDGWIPDVHEPVLLASYSHGNRFESQLLVACTGPARPPVRFDQHLGG